MFYFFAAMLFADAEPLNCGRPRLDDLRRRIGDSQVFSENNSQPPLVGHPEVLPLPLYEGSESPDHQARGPGAFRVQTI